MIATYVPSAPERVEPTSPSLEPRRIAVVPAYNEETTVAAVLKRLSPCADEVLIVNDGSTDATKVRIEEAQADLPNVTFVTYDDNRGMSEAYYAAFQSLRARLEVGELSADDIVLTVDADGQHDLAVIDRLTDRLVQGGYDAVIVQRDLSTYPRYKQFGNWVMSAWATLFAGMRYHDVESGYRAFRLGPLLHALEYYKGYKYSETIEVAVVLPLLGYRVNNDMLVPVPIYRSRTRMKDVVIDLVTAGLAWWRTATLRRAPALPRPVLYALPAVLLAAWVAVLGLMLTKAVFLGTDSVNNYAHVWYLQDRLFHNGEIPLHISLLDNGDAVLFPYGLVPWSAAALLFPILGDWSVTLLMVAGVASMIVTACLVRPAMRDPWLLSIFALNAFLVDAVLVFQFAFVWSTVFFFLFVFAAERKHWAWTAVLLWLTVATHPIMGGAAVGVYAIYAILRWREDQLPFVLACAAGGLAALPIAWLTLQTPSLGDNSAKTVILSVLDILPRRGLVMAAPFILSFGAGWVRRNYTLSFSGVCLGLAIAVPLANGAFHYAQGSYQGIVQGQRHLYDTFFAGDAFHPGSTYRVLEPNELEDGMYDFIRHRAILSSEFFTESTFRRSFTQAQYQCFLSVKTTDYVVLEDGYLQQYRTNEGDLLRSLVSGGEIRLVYTDPAGRFQVYDVRDFRDSAPAPVSLIDCQL